MELLITRPNALEAYFSTIDISRNSLMYQKGESTQKNPRKHDTKKMSSIIKDSMEMATTYEILGNLTLAN
jgi:hypothetical protein